MLRRFFGRKIEPVNNESIRSQQATAQPRYTSDDDALRLTILELLYRYGLFPKASEFAQRPLDELLDLQHNVVADFTRREEKWKRSALDKSEIETLNAALEASSLGLTGSPTLSHPASFWGPLSHSKIPSGIKRKLYARGLELITWPPDRHFLLMGALESRDGILLESERAGTLKMFADNRPIAARYMDEYGSGRPPFMGEDLLIDPNTTDWLAYQEIFFEVKTDFSKLGEWRKVHEIWHAHTKLSYEISQTYKQRDVIGVEPTIPLCQSLIAIAPEAKIALRRDHDLWFEYRSELQTSFLARRGKRNDEGWMPEYKDYTLPQHTGFRQLSIIYDKKKEYQAAIDVCREALAVDWPGDWNERISRYERKLGSHRKKLNSSAGSSEQ